MELLSGVAEPGTMTFMNSLLDRHSHTTDQIFKTGITLSTYPSTSIMEPFPHLDYFIIYRLITIARPHLNKHHLKRLDYVVDGRRSFYESFAKFQVAYRDLSDAHACAEILDKKAEELKGKLADALAAEGSANVTAARTNLDAVQTQRMRNNEDIRVRLELVNQRAKTRDQVAVWFSELKVVFLRDEVPWLVALGKQCYQHAMEQQASQSPASPIPAPSPHVRELMAKAGIAPRDESGGMAEEEEEAEGEGEASGFGAGFCEDEEGDEDQGEMEMEMEVDLL